MKGKDGNEEQYIMRIYNNGNMSDKVSCGVSSQTDKKMCLVFTLRRAGLELSVLDSLERFAYS